MSVTRGQQWSLVRERLVQLVALHAACNWHLRRAGPSAVYPSSTCLGRGHRDSESTRSRDGGCADRHGAELCAIAPSGSLLPVREGAAIWRRRLTWTWRTPLEGVQAHNLAGLATEATELRLWLAGQHGV